MLGRSRAQRKWKNTSLCSLHAQYLRSIKDLRILTIAKTDAQRQSERYARQIAAGLVQFKAWVHADDVQNLLELAEKLKNIRAKIVAKQEP